MSKRIWISVVMVLLIAINPVLIAQDIYKQIDKQAARKITDPKDMTAAKANVAEIVSATNEILDEVSKLRGLKILSPVKSGAKSRTEIQQEIIRSFDEESTPKEIENANKVLVAYGLVPKDFRYREFMVKLLTEQVAGFYRPKSKELFIADWNDLEQQKPVMVHELQHALQDQHFNLRRFEKWPEGDGDREMAIHALIEGDATAVMYNYQLKPMRSDITKLPPISSFSDLSMAQAERDKQAVFLSAPPALRESLIFSYVYGATFVQEILKKRDWNGVSQAFTDLPQSTEQILHFDKYEAKEAPVKVTLPDISKLLGADWKRIDADINGEWGYFMILSQFIAKKEARAAAAGWGGDQSVLYENSRTGALLLTHLSTWDTVEDAAEFLQAYADRTLKRYPTAKLMSVNARDNRAFQSPDEEIHLQLRGQSVLVIEGLPAEKQTAMSKLVEALWKQ
ncbi:MAG: hypothetical protein M3X11_14600 [Acidobacteriota bacterium]|nr:hypothetical protein [Acidobacteriota bacterium]